jgi:hypothetical protein
MISITLYDCFVIRLMFPAINAKVQYSNGLWTMVGTAVTRRPPDRFHHAELSRSSASAASGNEVHLHFLEETIFLPYSGTSGPCHLLSKITLKGF